MASQITSLWSKYRYYFLVFIGIGLLVYINGLFGSFVWDDIPQIQNNNAIHSISNLGTFFLGSTFGSQSSDNLAGLYYRPLMSTSFAFIYSLFGQQTFFYHFYQLAFHIANTILIFFFLKKFLHEKLSFFLSLIFLVHPINVEAVSYIATLGEPLFFFFGITALLLFQKTDRTLSDNLIISGLILLSLFAKETGILFGLILILYYFLFEKKVYKETAKVFAMALVPLGIYWVLRFQIAKVLVIKLPNIPVMTATLTERLLTMPAIFWFYIKTFFFPLDLFIWQEWMVYKPNGNFYFPLLIDIVFLTALAGLGTWIWKSNKKNFLPYLFFTLWFLIGVGFHMQILPLDMTVADHMFYFPMVGLLGVIGISVQNIKLANQQYNKILLGIVITIICIFSVRTMVRNADWSNGISLYGHDLPYERNDGMENRLAADFNTAGQYSDAQKHYELLLSRNPTVLPLILNLASVYESENKFQKAADMYYHALSLDNSEDNYTKYVNLLLRAENYKQAQIASNQALQKFPNNTTILLINALSSYKLGAKQLALQDMLKIKSLTSDPKMDQVYQGMKNGTIKY